MKYFISIIVIYFLILIASASFGQEASNRKVIVTGVRFAYPLVEKWIQEYKIINPAVDVVIESRTTTDPAKYDLLIEAYEPEQKVKDTRDYLYLGRYALLPVANASSQFAKIYSEKGLTADQLKQVYFHDVFADKKKKGSQVTAPVTVYTRLQKAGAPITFAHYFGYEQKDINGKAIAGSDDHLIKALLNDSTGVSYGSVSLLYNLETRKPLDGLSILPVDLDGNGRITEDEKIYRDPDALLEKLEDRKIKNVPIEYLHLSISKQNTNPLALKFLRWVLDHSQEDLHHFGFLKPEPQRFQQSKTKFEELAIN